MNAETQNSISQPQSWWCSIQSCGGMTATDRRNYRRFNYWALAWAFSFVASHLVLEEIVTQEVMVFVILTIPTFLTLFALRAYARFFRLADELTQRIHLEGIKIGFCTGLFFLPPIWLYKQAGGPSLEMLAFSGMILGFSIGLILAARRYR